MFRGSAPAKIDDKGRLKLPTQFRRTLEEEWGGALFITSFDGASARLYPLPVWERIEARAAALPSTDRNRQRFLERVNYFGQETALDAQGRLLIPQLLRERAAMNGEVMVLANGESLEVWNRERLERRIDEPLSEDELRTLAELGI
jgi:MraZ protein